MEFLRKLALAFIFIFQPCVATSDPAADKAADKFDQKTCVICTEEFPAGAAFERIFSKADLTMPYEHVEGRCGHRFDMQCLAPWISINNSCPVCKKSSLLETPNPFYLIQQAAIGTLSINDLKRQLLPLFTTPNSAKYLYRKKETILGCALVNIKPEILPDFIYFIKAHTNAELFKTPSASFAETSIAMLPLSIAIKMHSSHPDTKVFLNILKALLESGANPNAYTPYYNTPLHQICFLSNKPWILSFESAFESARLLIKKGADARLDTPNGRTPVNLIDSETDFNAIMEAVTLGAIEGKTNLKLCKVMDGLIAPKPSIGGSSRGSKRSHE
jgi:hypothetical protein